QLMTEHPNLHFFIADDEKNTNVHSLSLSKFISSDILKQAEIDNLFANWLFIEDVNDIGNYVNSGYLLLSPSFSISAAEHVVRLSKDSENSFSIIGAQSQIEKLDEEMDSVQVEIDQTESKLFELEDEKNEIESKLAKLQIEFQSAEKLLNSKQNELGQIEFEMEHLNKRYQQNQAELKELAEAIKVIDSELTKKEPEFKNLLTDEEKQGDLLDQAREKLTDFEHAYLSAKDKLHDLRIEKNNMQSNQKNITELIGREQRFIGDSDQQITHKEKEIVSLESQKKSISNESEDRKVIIDEMQLVREQILGEKSNVEDKYVDVKEKIKQLELAIRDHRQQRENFNETVQTYELKLNELNVKAQTIAERVYKEYDQVITTIKIPDDFELMKSEREVFSLRNKIVALGEVNSLAIEEYEKEKERLDFLSKQYDDLIKSEKLLTDTIKSINKTAKDQFQEVFDKVRKNFQLVFNQFFQRGEADIVLHEDAEDPLEGKIEIKVRPKGKALQTLTLMSGGEKTLTAISLLFAIYLVKPSPFCILDEVDAPLDDLNISRFTSALKNFTNRTQFIVITHNKRTMEAADYMYGVTQEEEGLSKLVSVKFD
ncbi:MAG: hypothetical protein KDD94_10430, partial [Calditrichaeota bacterium]|nr:hypothetical protein [Calditrichota bacterium]